MVPALTLDSPKPSSRASEGITTNPVVVDVVDVDVCGMNETKIKI